MKRRKRKSHKRRGHTTHGHGAMKKHRGAGNRGGRGNAGTGKGADAKKPGIDVKKYFGKHGFKSKKKKKQVINIGDLDSKIDYFTRKRYATGDKGNYILNLKKAGFHKLLAKGSISNKYEISILVATKRAKEKLERAGGKLNLLKPEPMPTEEKE